MRAGSKVAAKNCAHLFPGKTLDNIRKTIENTFKGKSTWGTKSAPAMEIRQQVTEEVKEIELQKALTTETILQEIYEFCKKQAEEAAGLAETSRDREAASRCFLPVTNILTKIASHNQQQPKSGLAEMREAMRIERDGQRPI